VSLSISWRPSVPHERFCRIRLFCARLARRFSSVLPKACSPSWLLFQLDLFERPFIGQARASFAISLLNARDGLVLSSSFIRTVAYSAFGRVPPLTSQEEAASDAENSPVLPAACVYSPRATVLFFSAGHVIEFPLAEGYRFTIAFFLLVCLRVEDLPYPLQGGC